nr:MAG TPA: hypothetical protein [Caudoviricetes sp.]DAQ14265.1 MAG TPA: hypothetical protein [Caudoviricetes sp.]
MPPLCFVCHHSGRFPLRTLITRFKIRIPPHL